jgi:hypothetical protein
MEGGELNTSNNLLVEENESNRSQLKENEKFLKQN